MYFISRTTPGLRPEHLRDERGGGVRLLREVLQRGGDQPDGVQPGDPPVPGPPGDQDGDARDPRLVSVSEPCVL